MIQNEEKSTDLDGIENSERSESEFPEANNGVESEQTQKEVKTETGEHVEIETLPESRSDEMPVHDGKTSSIENFNWDEFEAEEKRTSPKYAEYEAIYDKTLSTISVDQVVKGTVIQMTNREVVINIGYKSEGVVSLNEFRYNPNLKVGDTVEVYVESHEDKKGQLVLSHKKARALNSWERIMRLLKMMKSSQDI